MLQFYKCKARHSLMQRDKLRRVQWPRNAIKAMKTGKAPGVDSIHAEMLKADLSTATRVLTNLFDTIWDKETIPSDWGKGLIIKIPKKGNLQVCDNW